MKNDNMKFMLSTNCWIFFIASICFCQGEVLSQHLTLIEESESHVIGTIIIPDGETYRLSPESYDFELDGDTGELRNTRPIDRDTLESNIINLLAVTSLNSLAPIEISVEVLDINDNNPTFPDPAHLDLDIPENAKVGSQYFLPTATDTDEPSNGVTNDYKIIEGDQSKFILIIDSSPGDETIIYLQTNARLNREERAQYELNISAIDDGSPSLDGYLSVTVNILDNNDNSPIFDFSEYDVQVNESVEVGTEILKVNATDNDEGENGRVRYRFGAQSEGKELFSIQPDSGAITINQTLDFETSTSYRLSLEAFDAGDPVLFGRAFVTVSVYNVNDNDPAIGFRFVPQSATVASVEDNSPQGTLVALITATDDDSTREDREHLSLSLVKGNELKHFELIRISNLNVWRLQVRGPITLSTVSRYNLTFFVEDGTSSSSRSSYESLRVVVNSRNSHAPIFSQSRYYATLSEITAVGTFVASVEAKDMDFGLPSRLRYLIEEGDKLDWFAIDESTGLITSKARLHHELINGDVIHLSIIAEDESANPLRTNTSVYITVIDENDNAPEFDADVFEATVSENVSPVDIMTFSATDADQGENGVVEYSIAGVYPSQIPSEPFSLPIFTVESSTGKVRLETPLSRSEVQFYKVLLLASDFGTPTLTSTATILVKIASSSASAPEFYPTTHFVSIVPGSYVDFPVTTVKASVPDGLSNTIRYRKTTGDSSFTVNANTGVILASRNFQSLSTFVVQIRAETENIFSALDATVYIVVQDDLQSFKFAESEYEFAVLENTNSTFEIGQILVESNSLSPANITYSIVDGDAEGHFFIDKRKGLLFTKASSNIDFEMTQNFSLSIAATLHSDDGSFSTFSTALCQIYVKDENDNGPKFVHAQYLFDTNSLFQYKDTVVLTLNQERASYGTFVYNASATDADFGPNGEITYKVEDALDILEIDVNGIITLKKPFRPFLIEYNDKVRVTSCDKGSPCRCSDLDLSVVFKQWIGSQLTSALLANTIQVRVLENAPPNTIIAHLSTMLPSKYWQSTAVDGFGQIITVVKYEVFGGDPGSLFDIFPDGRMYVKHGSLDREITEDYIVSVHITIYENGQSYVLEINVLVHVLDENDNLPKFQRERLELSTFENASLHSVVGYINAHDIDKAIHADLIYSSAEKINSSKTTKALPFAVDRNTGAISTTCAINLIQLKFFWPDYLTKDNVFEFKVSAMDNRGSNSTSTLSTEVSVRTKIQNINEFPPVFSRNVYNGYVLENSGKGEFVVQLHATDIDEKIDLVYSLLPYDTDLPFTVNSSTGLLTVSHDDSLDREAKDFYSFSVMVSDSDSPNALSSISLVEVRVLDVNDNKPKFKAPFFYWSVFEGSDLYQEIGKLEAIDMDSFGPNSTINFGLSSENSDAARRTFYVDKSSGSVTAIDSLNREEQNSFDLIVTAYDSGVPFTGVSTATVKVTILDINDNTPVIQQPSFLHVSEGIYRQPYNFGALSASDFDKGNNRKISFQIVKQEPSSFEADITIDPNTGELYVSGELDREHYLPDGTISVTAKASDNPNTTVDQRLTWLTFDVTVDDVNDNSPRFISPDVVFIPARSTGVIGYEIATVTAEDPDDGLNGTVSYSLYSFDDSTLFSILPETGVVQLSEVIPDDQSIVFPMTVVARDEGVPGKFSMLEMKVIVGDPTTQNGPVFVSSSYNGNVMENEEPGTPILTVTATGNRVAYYISGVFKTGSTISLNSRPFQIHSNTGVISNLIRLDREHVASYILNVVAVDLLSTKTNPRMTSSQVTISLLDANDNSPMFPEPITEEVFISESTSPGFVIDYQLPTDADSTSVIEYSLQFGAESEDFDINPASGQLSIAAEGLDYEKRKGYNLKVIASDGVHEARAEVRIQVIDSNDHAPVFQTPIFVFSLEEGYSTPPNSGRYVGYVRASDEDTGLNSMIMYSFVNESHQGRFSLNSKTGCLNLNASYAQVFDREIQDLHVLTVRATDGEGRFSDADIYINIADINDNAPVFNNRNDFVNVPENARIGYNVISVHAVDVDLGLNGTVEYHIVGGDPKNQFKMDPTTGVITTIKLLDREVQAVHHLVIMASDVSPQSSRLFAYMNVTINLLDINDNPPELVMPDAWYVSEDVKPITEIMQIGAYDLDDITLNATSRFSFTLLFQLPDHGAFELDPQSGMLRTTGRSLDREETNRYTLLISVNDQGSPNLSSNRTLVVHVSDTNDNSPVFDFDDTYFTFRVAEDASTGSEIATIRATDIDEGYNGFVRYRLISQSNSQSFAIDGNSGLIYLTGLIDYERAKRHDLTIEAFDLGEPSRITIKNITVEVVDINDCAPYITPTSSIVRVDENLFPADILLQFQVFDDDTGAGGRTDFQSAMVSKVTKNSLDVSGNSNSLGTLFTPTSTGQLILNQEVDREMVDSYTVVVTVVDRGNPPLMGSASVLVTINDVNEYAPEFLPDNYEVFLPENSSVGTRVVTVMALDRDAACFGVVRYTLQTPDVPFIVDPTSGVIMTSGPLDREEEDKYELSIIAVDGEGTLSKSASALVVVKVTDDNDNTPTFTNASYIMYATGEANQLCGVVYADDADEGQNAEVVYSLLTKSLPFEIGLNSGTLSTVLPLDKQLYMFKVIASDKGNPPKSTSAMVTLVVHSDPFPVFASQPTTAIDIVENAPPNSEVLFHYQATSTRVGSSPIKYFLVGGNAKDSFLIDSDTGEVKQNMALDREENSLLNALVEARDAGSPSLSAYSMLTINVIDVNDNPPLFSKSLYVGSAKEDSLNELIVTVSAEDVDENNSGEFLFALDTTKSEFPEKFVLDPNSGVLGNRILLNREEKETYFLIVLVKDRGTPSLHSSATIKVIVEDVNDNPPSFTRLYSARIREDAMIGDYIVQVTSSDMDSQENAENLYSLSEDATKAFSIEPIQGLLTVNKKLDREKQSRYELQVNVGDSSWTSHTSITVTVTDVNDNPPQFDKESYSMDVNTGFSVNSYVLTVNAIDDDEGENAQVSYTLQNCKDEFSINHTSGEIFTAVELSCSTAPGTAEACPRTYTLLVTATDSGTPVSLSTATTVTVKVRRTNLHAPVFHSDFRLPIAVLQSTPTGTNIVKLTASDSDQPATLIQYEKTGGIHSSFFSLNETSGEVSLVKPLSSVPLRSRLTVVITAIDNGFPRLFTDFPLDLEVSAANQEKPIFSRKSYTALGMKEDAAVGSLVNSVVATDNDEGVNGKVLYSLSQDDFEKPFAINSSSGQVLTTGRLDFERTSSYVLTVIARDQASYPMMAEASLTIPILDVNDNPPVFNATSFVTYVSETVPPDRLITRVAATDADSSEYAVIHYAIFPQDDVVARTLTGDIFTGQNTYLDFEQRDTYEVMLTASNTEGNTFMDTTHLTIKILDENEFKPAFQDSRLSVQTSVNSQPGQVVTTLKATDEDYGESGMVNYFLAGWSEVQGFNCNPDTGEVYVSNNANFKLGDTIGITVFANNPGLSDQTTTSRVDITVRITTDECMANPCRNGGSCQDGTNGFSCACGPGFTGNLCEMNINECIPNPCKNSAQCTDLIADFSCVCPVGYTGKMCDADIDFCEDKPCLNGGTCVDGLSTYSCQCNFGSSGSNCEQNSLGFEPLSYLALQSLQASTKNIGFEFATVAPSSLLMYSYASESQSAFVALEVLQGTLRLSYNVLNNSTVRISTGENLADGLWHYASVTLGQSEANLVVDYCDVSEDTSHSCSVTRAHDVNELSAPLNELSHQVLYIGGSKDVVDIINRPNQVSSSDFVGCLRNIIVNSENIESTSSPAILQSIGVLNGCPRSASDGSDACTVEEAIPVCGEGAACVDKWSSVFCECSSDRSGRVCQNERVGSSFNGVSYLVYEFLPEVIQQQLLASSGALNTLLTAKRRKRTTVNDMSSISVRFRTRTSNGIILQVKGSENSMSSLAVEDGALLYIHTSISGFKKQHTISERIEDGMWHNVTVQLTRGITDTTVTVTLDDSVVVNTAFGGGIQSFADSNSVQTIYLGGSPDDTNSLDGFQGCVFSFYLNGQSQPLADDSESSILTVKQTSSFGNLSTAQPVSQGCPGSDVCASNPCAEDNLYCNDIWEAYECIPFGGCISSPCLNGASCRPHKDGSYDCFCAVNYSGVFCEVFIPCQTVDCSSEGPNRLCGSSNGSAVCVCLGGFSENDGVCVALASPNQTPFWVFVICGVVGIILLIIVIVCCIRRFSITRKSKKNTATTNGVTNAKKTPEVMAKGSSTIGRSNQSFEFDRIGESGSPPYDHRDIDDEAGNFDELTSSGIGSTRSTTSSPLKDLPPTCAETAPSNDAEKDLVLRKYYDPKPNTPLPSYEYIMQKRSGTPNSGKSRPSRTVSPLSMRGSDKTSPRASRSTPIIPCNFFDYGSDDTSSVSIHPLSSISSPSQQGRSATKRPFPKTRMTSSINSTQVHAANIPYLPSGRVSPTKSPTSLLYASDQGSTQQRYTPSGRRSGYRTSSSTYSRKISGSVASSSTDSTSSTVSTKSPENTTSIGDMVQHLNGLVGLTNEEIELLNVNPVNSHDFSSSASESMSSVPSTIHNHSKKKCFTNIITNPEQRPSSLPGRRINRLPIESRSRTPMLLPPTSPYKSLSRSREKYGDIPSHLQPSEFLQPPPDTSSEEEDYVFEKPIGRPLSRMDEYPNDSSSTASEGPKSSYIKNMLHNPADDLQLDFLMSYGKHHEGLAGLFEDLAALPTIKDEEEVESETSFSITPRKTPVRTSSLSCSSSSDRSKNCRPQSCNHQKSSLSSASGHSMSSRSQSMNRKHQEHYV